MAAVNELTPVLGAGAACRAMGLWRGAPSRQRAQAHRATLLGPPEPRTARTRPPLALDAVENQALLDTLNSDRFVDTAPAAVHATLLDEGRYLGSVRTMYRLLAANGGCRERRNQLTHPAYTKPELLAIAPNQVWSWDISAPCRRGLQRMEKGVSTVSKSCWLVLDRQLKYCPAPMGIGRKGAAKLGRLPTAGCHAQSSLNCTGRGLFDRVPGYRRVYGETTKCASEASVLTHTLPLRRGHVARSGWTLCFLLEGAGTALGDGVPPQPSSGATRGRARHLRT